MADDEQRVRYAEPRLAVDVGFWTELRRRRLCEWQLREVAVRACGFVHVASRADGGVQLPHGDEAQLVQLRAESLPSCSDDDSGATSDTSALRVQAAHEACVPVLLTSYNTLAALEQCDMHALAQQALTTQLLAPLLTTTTTTTGHAHPTAHASSAASTRGDTAAGAAGATCACAATWSCAPYLLCMLATYVDAKAYRFHYRAAFPALALRDGVCVQRCVVGLGANAWPAASLATATAVHAHAAQRRRGLQSDSSRHGASRTPLDLFLAVDETTQPSQACRNDGSGNDDDRVSFVDYDAAVVARRVHARPPPRVALVCVDDGAGDAVAAHVLSWSLRNALACLRLAVPSLTALTLYVLHAGGTVQTSALLSCRCGALDAADVHAQLMSWHAAASCSCALPSRSQCAPATVAAAPSSSVDEASTLPLLRCVGVHARRPVACVSLAAALDPVHRADADARMNLELMRWRMLPSLDLHPLAQCRALLLGVGTLGCNVARQLLAWGVRTLTLVDRGVVAYSNLARQSLYTLADAQSRRAKAHAAADALRAIVPSADVRSEVLTLHMPGHRVDDDDAALRDMAHTIDLICSHDVVFLLTDSREARWLPTVVATAHGVPVLNAALGFDTYVVMRHGMPPATVTAAGCGGGTLSPSPSLLVPSCATQHDTARRWATSDARDLGCYFCSDVVGPCNSTHDRTLDQQCTVTRPAVSAMAAALAVELLAQLSQHPRGFCCPAYTSANDDAGSGVHDSATSCLGVIPQQIRGSVHTHTMTQLRAARSPHCTACSSAICTAYADGGTTFLLRCVNDPRVIEHVCGIAALRQQWDADDMTSAEWE